LRIVVAQWIAAPLRSSGTLEEKRKQSQQTVSEKRGVSRAEQRTPISNLQVKNKKKRQSPKTNNNENKKSQEHSFNSFTRHLRIPESH
jgi:hypothetical protein